MPRANFLATAKHWPVVVTFSIFSTTPVFAACDAVGKPLEINESSAGPISLVESKDVVFVGPATITAPSPLVTDGTSPLNLSIINRATHDITGDDGIRIEEGASAPVANICYDGEAGASITADQRGIAIYTSGEGSAVLAVAHDIVAGTRAIDVVRSGPGAVSVTSTAPLKADSVGIFVMQTADGDVSIAAADISARTDGVLLPTGIQTEVYGAGTTRITARNIAAETGIKASSTGPAEITVTGTIGTELNGVEIIAASATVSIASDAAITSANGVGINSYLGGKTEIIVAGSIAAPATAIQLGSGENLLALEPGYHIDGIVDARAFDSNGDLVDTPDDTLVFGGTGSASFDLSRIDSQYLGFDNFRKTGTSTWSFSGAAPTRFQLSADAGTIKIDQAIGIDLILTGTATIGGTGQINSLSLDGGTLAPGNSIGTLTVAGNATIGANTTYIVEVNAAGASDRLDVLGTATIGSNVTVQVVLAKDPSYDNAPPYTILTAASISGAFIQPPTVDSPFYKATLRPDDTANPKVIFLDLERNGVTVTDQGQTPNQKQEAATIDAAGPAAPHLSDILTLTAPEIPSALSALSGDGYASLITAMLDGAGHLPAAAFEPHPSRGVWTRPYGRFATLASDGNGPAVNVATGGIDMGADELIGRNQIGVLIGYGETGFSLPSRNMSASAAEFSLGAHGSIWWDDTYLRLGAAVNARRMTVTRQVIFTGVSDSYSSSFAGLTAHGFGELGHSFRVADAVVTPFGGLAAIESLTAGFTESSTGAAPLTVAPNATTAFVTTIGARIERQFVMADAATVTLRASAAWHHRLGGQATIVNRLAGAPGFSVTGAPLPADTFELTAGAQFALSPNLSLDLAYAGTFTSHALSATVAGQI